MEHIVITKRSGENVPFDASKIGNAIRKANKAEGIPSNRATDDEIRQIEEAVATNAETAGRPLNVEEIQDMAEEMLMEFGRYQLARRYIIYRSEKNKERHNGNREDKEMTTLEKRIVALVETKSDENKEENANKNPVINSTQRDYMAGEVSKEISQKFLLPKDVVEAHEQGIIHFHDMDYYVQREHNCELLNLEDMLQNGTAISGTKIDRPHSFATACTVTSQIVAQVCSCSYGGQTFSLAHLAPFVDVSRQKIRSRLKLEFESEGMPYTENQLGSITEKELMKEVEAGIQTIQYQLITLMTTNGQAPFVTVFMYLHEVPEGQTRDDLALLIKVMLEQRILGVKDKYGTYITPAFPKLIYVLQEDNIREGTKYWYLTELAAKCTAKRMVPDYISEKKAMELKGDVYPCMGCVGGEEAVTYRWSHGIGICTSIEVMFETAYKNAKNEDVTVTESGSTVVKLNDVMIYDNKAGWTKCLGIIKNQNSSFIRVRFNNEQTILCTPDHPFETENRGLVEACSLKNGDRIYYRDGAEIIVTGIEFTNFEAPSYDVTTASEHFMVSGIYSHNCRSFLTPDRFTDAGIGNVANAGNYKSGEHKYYGRLTA